MPLLKIIISVIMHVVQFVSSFPFFNLPLSFELEWLNNKGQKLTLLGNNYFSIHINK